MASKGIRDIPRCTPQRFQAGVGQLYTALSGTLAACSTDRQRQTAVEGLGVVACGTFVRADNLLQLMLTDHVVDAREAVRGRSSTISWTRCQ